MTNSALIRNNPRNLKKLQQQNILLVEDDLLNAKLVSILFAQHGLRLQLANNGLEAVEMIRTNHFDIVLMDMEMPLINGYQATAMIRKQLKIDMPIIALTAHALAGEREKCLSYGMNDYVVKPIDPDLLFTSMYQAMCGNKTASTKKRVSKIPAKPVDVEKVCNMDYLVAITRGNKKNIQNIVSVFFKETRKELIYLDKAIKKINYPLISDISHKIKTAFSILGISVLEPVFKEMEQLSSATSPIKRIEQLNRRVNIVFKKAKAEMKAVY